MITIKANFDIIIENEETFIQKVCEFYGKPKSKIDESMILTYIQENTQKAMSETYCFEIDNQLGFPKYLDTREVRRLLDN